MLSVLYNVKKQFSSLAAFFSAALDRAAYRQPRINAASERGHDGEVPCECRSTARVKIKKRYPSGYLFLMELITCCGIFIIVSSRLPRSERSSAADDALRLKHGRSASRLKPLPRTPCFCASSYSLHPPQAAVVLVTFKSGYQLFCRGKIKTVQPDDCTVFMELITGFEPVTSSLPRMRSTY